MEADGTLWTTLLNWTLNACGFEGRKSMATGCFTVSLCDLSFVYSVESREPATKTGQATRTSQGDMKGPGLKSSRTTELGTVRKQSAMRRHATRVPNVLFLVCAETQHINNSKMPDSDAATGQHFRLYTLRLLELVHV